MGLLHFLLVLYQLIYFFYFPADRAPYLLPLWIGACKRWTALLPERGTDSDPSPQGSQLLGKFLQGISNSF